MTDVNQIVAEFARLKERVANLEKCAFASGSTYVEGWTNAARVVGVSTRTVRRRADAGEWPKPCRIEIIYRKDGNNHSKPTWRRADLEAYAEGK